MFKDRKYECEDFEEKQVDQSLYTFKWVSCEHGHRSGRFYLCKKYGLYCPYHWLEKYNPGWHTRSGYG